MQVITSQEHQRNYKKIRERVANGEHFIVTHHDKPMFKLVPFTLHSDEPKLNWEETISALEDLQTNSDDKNLSLKVDEVAWQ